MTDKLFSRPEFRRRVFTGAVLFICITGLVLAAEFTCSGKVLLLGIIAALSLLAAYECARILDESRLGQALLVLSLLLPLCFVFSGAQGHFCSVSLADHPSEVLNAQSITSSVALSKNLSPSSVLGAMLAGLVLAVSALSVRSLWTMGSPDRILRGLGGSLVGVLHVGAGCAAVFAILCLSQGVVWFGYLVLVVALGDIAAYLVGSSVGGPKLLPAVSPGKTWSGAGGGLCVSVLTSLVYGILFVPQASTLGLLFLGALVAVIAQLGDLLKSTLKRSAGVKDSGAILPGHGGIYDRCDGILSASCLLLAVLVAYGGQ